MAQIPLPTEAYPEIQPRPFAQYNPDTGMVYYSAVDTRLYIGLYQPYAENGKYGDLIPVTDMVHVEHTVGSPSIPLVNYWNTRIQRLYPGLVQVSGLVAINATHADALPALMAKLIYKEKAPAVAPSKDTGSGLSYAAYARAKYWGQLAGNQSEAELNINALGMSLPRRPGLVGRVDWTQPTNWINFYLISGDFETFEQKHILPADTMQTVIEGVRLEQRVTTVPQDGRNIVFIYRFAAIDVK